MKFLSVCSGIEAASEAWKRLGWEAVAFSEIEPFPCAVLKHHHPNTPNFGDMTRFHEWPDDLQFDLLAGGTPCQGFSIAGLREGMDDPRSQLSITFVEIAARYRPRWVVWENVPGVLSSEGGADFATLLGTLTGREIPIPEGGWQNSGHVEGIPAAYGVAWRVLDAQHFGVPQRRRRIFLVGYLGDWRRAAAVLFERESLRGDSPPSREAREGVAPCLSARTKGGGGLGTDFDLDGGLVQAAIAPAVTSKWAKGSGGPSGDECQNLITAHTTGAGFWQEGFGTLRGREQDSHENLIAHALRGEGFDASEDVTGRGTPLVPVAFSCKDHGADAGEIAPTLRSMSHDGSHANAGGQVAVAFQEAQTGVREYDTAGTLRADGPGHDPVGTRIREGMSVRRLTPRECERLQGFPDDHTRIPHWNGWRAIGEDEDPAELAERGIEVRQNKKTGKWRVKDVDGPRYKALGNSWAVPCAHWVGERIDAVERMVA